ncbi:hypothetical protein niasHS_016582 [Heterodera schachtii]|uniref:ABC transporter domain-containing protein n=1 Tax=Heterodera schachtii TaxID=97005 RepID=A0ABD2HUI2_HETSC
MLQRHQYSNIVYKLWFAVAFGRILSHTMDVKLENVDISFGNKLISSADLLLVFGHRYGLVGRNGIGKTTLLTMLSCKQLVIPSNITMLSVEQEVEGDETPVIDFVLASDTRREALLAEERRLQAKINRPVLQPVEFDSDVVFHFKDCDKLGNPVLQLDEVAFRYSKETPYIFQKVCIGSRSDSRICIVGENGAGKTTLLKLLLGDHRPTNGTRSANRRLNIGYFTQHHVDQLDLDDSPLELLGTWTTRRWNCSPNAFPALARLP